MAKSLVGKVSIITGGAGGIGKALAEEMSERGCHVVLADVNDELLQETLSELRAAGAKVDARKVDVRDAEEVAALVQGVFRELGRIDYMFNNAGINVLAELLDTSLDDWNRLIDVNLRGVVHGVHAVYPLMCEQGFGHIINTASVAGVAPTPAEGAYAATKHAVVGLSTALRIEAEAFGVKVSVVCPGAVDTAIIRTSKHVKFDADAIAELSPEKPMPARRAAQLILRGVDRGRFFIVISKTANAFWRVYRFAPEGSLTLGKFVIKKIRAIKHDA